MRVKYMRFKGAPEEYSDDMRDCIFEIMPTWAIGFRTDEWPKIELVYL